MQKINQTRKKGIGLIIIGLVALSVLLTQCKKEDLIPTTPPPPPPAPTTGQGMFWAASDLGCGNITVTIGSSSGVITNYYNTSIPNCGAAYCATFTLTPGTYSYTATCSSKTWSGSITITAGDCSKIQLTSSGGGSTTGQGMFWIASDLGCGNINVTVNGITRTISTFYASAPSCGASGCATFDLSPGTYAYSASCSGKTWNSNITITAGGCNRIQLTSSGGGSTTGQGMFWIASDLNCGTVNVTINGITRSISQFYASSPPCSSPGCATFDLSPGTYSYTASCSGRTWNGNITITTGGCSKIQLTGTVTTGQATFWIASDLGCGNINVTCNGITRTISQYYASTPSCGASGCANFTLNPGNYSFTASCSGKNWSGNISVTAGGCQLSQLY